MVGNAPRNVSPKERAENCAVRFAYWFTVAVPATIALMMFGYADQAPGWLREATVGLDATNGFWCCG
ncbi:MAG TPA: hypothetical protein VI358_19890 [Pseudolabrys sp.]